MARLAARNALALAWLAATHGGQVVTGEPAVGLRVWVNDEAIAMVESAVRPVRRSARVAGACAWEIGRAHV